MIDADINHLRPVLRNIVVNWLHIVRDDLQLSVRVMETLRDSKRQADVLAAGASKVSFGFHNLGLAFDFGCFEPNGVYIKNGDDRRYEQCGQIGEALGLKWGGRFMERLPSGVLAPNKDAGHLELHIGGKTLEQIMEDEGLSA